MKSIENSDTWRQIPPEEKFELMSRANSRGVLAGIFTIIIGSTIAMALQIGAIMWFSIIFAPFVFQFTAGKAWRGLRPRVMLEYLAVRSAARRFAFTNGGKELTAGLIFRGKLSAVYENAQSQEALEDAINNVHEVEVWVTLFKDIVIMLSEQPGGAVLALGHQLNDKIRIESSDRGGYTNSKEVLISTKERNGSERRYKLTSKYPAALTVFEKKALQFQQELKSRVDSDILATTALALEEDDNLGLGLGR